MASNIEIEQSADYIVHEVAMQAIANVVSPVVEASEGEMGKAADKQPTPSIQSEEKESGDRPVDLSTNSEKRAEGDNTDEPATKKKKTQPKKPLPSTPTLISLSSKNLRNFKVTHKRSIYDKSEALEVRKLRIGSEVQYVGPIRPSQLQWMRVIHSNVLETVSSIQEGEDIRYPLGDNLYISVNEYQGLKIVHIRYFFKSFKDEELVASKNGISVAAHKYNDLVSTLLSFDINLEEETFRKRLLVGQTIQNNIRKRLSDIIVEKNKPTEMVTNEFFIKEHIKTVVNEMEVDMETVFRMYEKVSSYIDYPAIEGRIVVSHFYDDALKETLMELTTIDEDYHNPSQMIIETIEDKEANE